MEVNFEQVFKKISNLLNESKAEWVLVGSTNQYLQGMDKIPNDIDIGIRRDNFELIKNLFKNFNKIKDEKERFKFEIKGIQIDVSNPYGGIWFDSLGDKDLIFLEKEGIKIPCFPLEVEANCYEKIGKKERANKIKEFIKI